MKLSLVPRAPRRVVLWASLLALAAVATAMACSASPAVRSPRPSLLQSVKAHPAYASPATWRYHPREAAGLVARRELGGGRVLLAGERGERWLVDEKKRVRAAAQLAPEKLIFILEQAGGGLLFVGESGTGYEAREPLGAFIRSSAPLDPLVQVTAAGSTIAAVRRDGTLVRSADAGATWQQVGPAGVRFADLALIEDGRGLAFSVPERLWQTRDAGAGWEPIEVESVGALGFARDDEAGLLLQGVLGWYRWDAASSQLVPLERAHDPERHELPTKPPRGPSAEVLLGGHAVFVAGRYLELEKDPAHRDDWRLWHGRAETRLRSRRVEPLEDCRATRIAAYDRWLTVACQQAPASSQTHEIVFFQSADRGKSYQREDFVAFGRLDALKMAMGAGGALVLSGVCPPHSAASGCQAQGIVHRRRIPADAGRAGSARRRDSDTEQSDAGAPANEESGDDEEEKDEEPEIELASSAAPSLRGAAEALAFSTDGRVAYAVGRRTKNRAYALFVSVDGGRTFEPHEIEPLGPDAAPEQESSSYHSRARASPVRGLAPAEDGSVAVVFHLSDHPLLVVFDEEGRVISVSKPPADNAQIGAVGTRGLALSAATRQAWETVDGGANWKPIGRLPLDPCPGDRSCEVQVACHLGGCVVGDELSRLGWHGQVDDDPGLLPAPDPDVPAPSVAMTRTPLTCTLDEKPWQPLGLVTAAPTADQAAIGEAVWYMPFQDDAAAQAAVLHARGGTRPRVETVTLLDPVSRAERYACAVWMQIEGAVAVRYRIPEPGPGGVKLRNVEVAWDDLLAGRLVRARIPDAGPYRPGDSQHTGDGAQRARPDLLSIGSGGVFVRIHHSERAQRTLFLDGRSVASIPGLQWPHVVGATSHPEMANVNGAHVPILFAGPGTAVVRARRDAGRWVFDAAATGLATPQDFGLVQASSIAYAGGLSGRHVMTYDAAGRRHQGLLFPFRADGAVVDPPIEVPMQLDTGEQPSRCSARRRSTSPRVVVPHQPGTRHPVIVLDVEEPMRVLLTGQAVMHGTPDAPCVAALDASIVAVDGGPEPQGEHAILPLDDLEHSWLFRKLPGESGGTSEIEVRLMSCRFDPKAHVPPDVYQAPGTRVRRRW